MIDLKIASPEKELYNGKCKSVVVKTIAGTITVLPNHAPLISLIENGYVKVDDQVIEIEEGAITVQNNSSVQILIK